MAYHATRIVSRDARRYKKPEYLEPDDVGDDREEAGGGLASWLAYSAVFLVALFVLALYVAYLQGV